MTWLPAVVVASGPSDAALPLNGYQPYIPTSVTTIDGMPWTNLTPAFSRVLLVNQGGSPGTPAASNGIWIYQGLGSGFPMTRPTTAGDYVHGTGLDSQTVVRVNEGTSLAHTEWVCITQAGIIVDSTPTMIQPGSTVGSSPLSLSTAGVNVDVPVATTSVISLTGSGPFAIAGLAGGWEGREVTLFNPTSYPLTIKHQDSADETVAANRIICAAGTDLTLPPSPGGFSWVRLRYCTLLPGPTSRWLAMDSSTPQLAPWQFLPQVKLSLRSDTGVTVSSGAVTNWADQSGAGNSVSVGATATSGPAFSATGGPNGFPILSGFSSTAYLDNTSSNIVASGADRTVLFVGQPASVGGDYFTFRRSTSGGTQTVSTFAYVDLSGTYYCWTDAVLANNATFPGASFFTTPVIIIATYHQSSLLLLRVNGSQVTTSSGGALSAETGTNGFSIGVSEVFTSPPWDGSILEQHVCGVQLTLDQCSRFENYASARYGIAI